MSIFFYILFTEKASGISRKISNKSSKDVEDRRDISTPRSTGHSTSTDNPPSVEHQADSGVGNEYSFLRPRRRRRPRINPFSEGISILHIPDTSNYFRKFPQISKFSQTCQIFIFK